MTTPSRSGPLVLVGLMGAGKTTVGQLVADRLDRPFSDSDAWLVRRSGRTAREIESSEGLDHLVDVDDLTPDAVAEAIVAYLGSNRQTSTSRTGS